MKIRGQLIKNPKERLLSLFEKDKETLCWNWKGNLKGKHTLKQYGSMIIGSRTDNSRKTIAAHRYSYEIFIGKFPDELWVLHKCDNPKCINPDHLFLGNRQDNVNDRENKKRNKIPNLRHDKHPNSKVNWSTVNEIRNRYTNGESVTAIVNSLNNIISRRAASDIVNNKTWKPSPPEAE